jgi:hypothetical protein
MRPVLFLAILSLLVLWLAADESSSPPSPTEEIALPYNTPGVDLNVEHKREPFPKITKIFSSTYNIEPEQIAKLFGNGSSDVKVKLFCLTLYLFEAIELTNQNEELYISIEKTKEDFSRLLSGRLSGAYRKNKNYRVQRQSSQLINSLKIPHLNSK